jgi:hypothetical protein
MHKDLIILNGPRLSILAFVRAITLKGYHTCTRINGPSTSDNIVALVDLVQKEVSYYKKDWYDYWHKPTPGKAKKIEIFFLPRHWMKCLVRCKVFYDHYMIRKGHLQNCEARFYSLFQYSISNDIVSLRYNTKCKDSDTVQEEWYAISFYKFITHFVPIRETRYKWNIANGNY